MSSNFVSEFVKMTPITIVVNLQSTTGKDSKHKHCPTEHGRHRRELTWEEVHHKKQKCPEGKNEHDIKFSSFLLNFSAAK